MYVEYLHNGCVFFLHSFELVEFRNLKESLLAPGHHAKWCLRRVLFCETKLVKVDLEQIVFVTTEHMVLVEVVQRRAYAAAFSQLPCPPPHPASPFTFSSPPRPLLRSPPPAHLPFP